MGVPSGVFRHAHAGRLQIVFNARFRYNGAEVGTPPGGNGIFVRCVAGTGDAAAVAMLSYVTQTAVLEVAYPGGLVDVPVSMSLHLVVDNAIGPVVMTADRLLIACKLLPEAG